MTRAWHLSNLLPHGRGHRPRELRAAAAVALCAAACLAAAASPTAPPQDYASELAAWRQAADARLRQDLGWLTIAGRWELKSGDNTLGAGSGNDIVLPRDLAPPRLGRLRVGRDAVVLALAPGQRMWTEPAPGKRGEEFTERTLKPGGSGEEWVTSGRLSMNVFRLDDGRTVLRIADRESANRKRFAGRVWYPVDPALRLPARFVGYAPGTKIPVANVRGEISEEDAAGYVEFELQGKRTRLDAFQEDDGSLFLIVRDGTSGAGTYPAGRFLRVEKPADGRTTVDFNRLYNPPCAFSAYTTCPLPPPQNWLGVPVAAGERYASGAHR